MIKGRSFFGFKYTCGWSMMKQFNIFLKYNITDLLKDGSFLIKVIMHFFTLKNSGRLLSATHK